eukprot:TRINITY_DN88073_c1_g1_i1.p1 TRINITY_DN88073_c1_g1~~TRINITY_DN88073_c1_g1_i1.p1  ORF type:complete len:453 (-),score=13.03 TRINITY_DN88073_c1_g1_i1:440-1798(-)
MERNKKTDRVRICLNINGSKATLDENIQADSNETGFLPVSSTPNNELSLLSEASRIFSSKPFAPVITRTFHTLNEIIAITDRLVPKKPSGTRWRGQIFQTKKRRYFIQNDNLALHDLPAQPPGMKLHVPAAVTIPFQGKPLHPESRLCNGHGSSSQNLREKAAKESYFTKINENFPRTTTVEMYTSSKIKSRFGPALSSSCTSVATPVEREVRLKTHMRNRKTSLNGQKRALKTIKRGSLDCKLGLDSSSAIGIFEHFHKKQVEPITNQKEEKPKVILKSSSQKTLAGQKRRPVSKMNKYYAYNYSVDVNNTKPKGNHVLLSNLMEKVGLFWTSQRLPIIDTSRGPSQDRNKSPGFFTRKVSESELSTEKDKPSLKRNEYQNPRIKERLERIHAHIERLKKVKTAYHPLKFLDSQQYLQQYFYLKEIFKIILICQTFGKTQKKSVWLFWCAF